MTELTERLYKSNKCNVLESRREDVFVHPHVVVLQIDIFLSPIHNLLI